MADTKKVEIRVTYGRLHKALAALGFVRRKTEGFTAYREAAHDALIVLPNRSPENDVGDPHLVTVRNTVTGKGIASADKLQALLVGPHNSHSTTKAQAYKRASLRVKPRKPSPHRLVSRSTE